MHGASVLQVANEIDIKVFESALCYFLAPFYVLLCCATVYIQAHYLVDVIAGWISAVCIYIVATYMYKRWFASVVFQLVLK